MNKIRQFSTSVKNRIINWSINGTTQDVTRYVVLCDHVIETDPALKKIKEKYPHASVEGNPHPTPWADGRVDPNHLRINFKKTAASGSTIGAHFYPATGLLRFKKGDIPDVVLSEEQKAEAEAKAAAKPFVLLDKKKGIPVVWQDGEFVPAAEQ
ncbi:hypothetical protein PRZ48_005978 [Zasmidium cellare]|uniref:Uncharacterized protein n=1 Tax=Zasmidium cellare TaxID=395010 RepID=A0ABR0EP14_ZASCE|nr:hypothetical protein PRZ48_005978 [Zasmidium cellare]